MLFYYAVSAANDNNWLHEWFAASITGCLDAVDAHEVVPSWATLTANHVAALGGRNVVRQEFFALVDAYGALEEAERATVRAALANQFNVAEACATGVSLRAADLPPTVAAAAITFGERLFWLLDQLKVRKGHYQQIWDALPNRSNVCPFCALTDLDHPELPAEDLDHYLSRKIYPFAAADLHNLAPMCSRCNMDYKGAKDVLSGHGEVQRHYPYDMTAPGGVTLNGSQFFVNGDGNAPAWQIELQPQAKGAEWDRIFNIRDRYRQTVLDQRWLDWLEEWAATLPPDMPEEPEDIQASLGTWAQIWATRGTRDKAFLKAAYLTLVRDTLAEDSGESRQLLAVLRQQISMHKAAA